MASQVAYSLHWELCHEYQDVLARRLEIADVAVTEHSYSIYSLLAARGARNIPYACIMHTTWKCVTLRISWLVTPSTGLPFAQSSWRLFVTSQLTIACSQDDVNAFANEYGADGSQIALIENGVDALGVPEISAETRTRYREELRVGSRKIAIFAGSFHQPNFLAADIIIDLAKKDARNAFRCSRLGVPLRQTKEVDLRISS